MFVSAPIPQICLILCQSFKDTDLIEECMMHLEEISTTEVETKAKTFDDRFTQFVRRLQKEQNLIHYTSAFISFYFNIVNHKRLSEMFNDLMNENSTEIGMLSTYDSGYLTGIFSVCLMADYKMNNKNIQIPKDIQEAINYIESDDFIVHIEKAKK